MTCSSAASLAKKRVSSGSPSASNQLETDEGLQVGLELPTQLGVQRVDDDGLDGHSRLLRTTAPSVATPLGTGVAGAGGRQLGSARPRRRRPPMPPVRRLPLAGIAALGVAALIAGCGGGGSDCVERRRLPAGGRRDLRRRRTRASTRSPSRPPGPRCSLPRGGADDPGGGAGAHPGRSTRRTTSSRPRRGDRTSPQQRQEAHPAGGRPHRGRARTPEAVTRRSSPEITGLRDEARAKANELGPHGLRHRRRRGGHRGDDDHAPATTAGTAGGGGDATAATGAAAQLAADRQQAIDRAQGVLQAFSRARPASRTSRRQLPRRERASTSSTRRSP